VQRNIQRAYDALWAEHQRIHCIHVEVFAQGDVELERGLMRRKLEDRKYLDELLDHEERLTRQLGSARTADGGWPHMVRLAAGFPLVLLHHAVLDVDHAMGELGDIVFVGDQDDGVAFGLQTIE
jgi:hypothetical protein